jgi:hypothetical protein
MTTYQWYQLTSPRVGLFYEHLEYIFGLSSSVLLTGDLSCKHANWNNHCLNRNGELLAKWVNLSDSHIRGPSDPTSYAVEALMYWALQY